MINSKNIALACSMLVAAALAVSPMSAAPKAHKHPVAATPQTVESLKDRPQTKLKLAKNETILYVGDLHCKHCAKSIASRLYTVKGVVKVRTDVKADVAIVTPQRKKQLDPLKLWAAAKASGFPAIKLVGPSGTFVLDAKTKTAQRVPDKTATPKS